MGRLPETRKPPVGGSLCGVPSLRLSRVFPAGAVACPSFSSSFAYRPLLRDLACPAASWSRVLCAVFWWGFGVPSLEFPRVPLLPFRAGRALKIQGALSHLTASDTRNRCRDSSDFPPVASPGLSPCVGYGVYTICATAVSRPSVDLFAVASNVPAMVRVASFRTILHRSRPARINRPSRRVGTRLLRGFQQPRRAWLD